ncbi:partner and localizer of BRCA2 [Aplochiton taeniatus]
MEDNLNCSLDCEDKEMLRRKLALLKMEYSRTAQRLLRAERSQVVRHVKSRITDQNRLNDTDLAGLASPYPNGASPSLHLGSPAATFTDSPLLPDSDTIPVLTENPRRSTMVRFVLPSETTCRLTPDPFLSLAGYRASPAGRLMSRRSRLRLERRNDERMTREMEVEVVEESEELVACSDSESPSLMPSQLMVARGGAMEEQEVGRVEKQGEAEVEESESPSLLLTHWSPATHIGVGKLDVTDKEKEMPVEKLVESLPDSYTVVEGLPFPAEYYVRTTRRMSSSQSQPNLQAVILNQFAGGRQRKGRSRGAKRQGTPRGSNTQANGHSSSPMQTKPLPGAEGAEHSPVTGRLDQKVYPIFTRSCAVSNRPQKKSKGSWRSLLLPCSPSPSIYLSRLPPLCPAPLPRSLGRGLANVDLLQDFHLPDDQFALLKLNKLRQFAMATAAEPFSWSPYNTRRATIRRAHKLYEISSGFTSKCPVECPPSTQADEVPKRSPVCPTKDPTTTRSPSPSPKPPAELLADRPAEKEILMASPVDCSTKTPPRASSQLGSLAQRPPPPRASSQLLLSPSLASPTSPLLSPRLVSSALPFSPPLPSIGLTPHLFTPDRPRSSPTSGLPLNLPLSPSPSARSLSPPPLSACPTLGPLPSSPPRLCHASRPPSLTRCCTPSRPLRGFFPPSNQEEPCDCSPVISNQSHDTTEPIPISQSFPLGSLLPSLSPHGRAKGAGGQFETLKIEEKTAGCVMKCTHTIQTPAGGCLVDACCVPTPSGGVCVAAAGEWAVCVWAETSSSHWSLIHTWTFKEPVISVFPVLDAAGLLCVTLGQLEIRQVRVLSCSRLQQVLLREGEIQTAVGVANARVVSSSHSAAGMALQVSSLSQDGSVQGSLPLASPGVFVWALAAVEGLPDALIGSANDALLLVWNTRTGQLLRRISLAENLAHTACLRGFSSCGVLFVLLQHQSLSSPREDEGGARKDEGGLFSAEAAEKGKRSGRVVFSLVATNPLSGKSALATRLGLPTAWSRRLCEADVLGTSVVGVSQCGRLCVWELGGLAGSRVVWDPEDTAWQLARWGGRDSLLVGHNNGDLSFYHCTPL